jgi:hypothetical protein
LSTSNQKKESSEEENQEIKEQDLLPDNIVEEYLYYRNRCSRIEAEITIYFKFAFKNVSLMLLDDDPEVREQAERVMASHKMVDLHKSSNQMNMEQRLEAALKWRDMVRG